MSRNFPNYLLPLLAYKINVLYGIHIDSGVNREFVLCNRCKFHFILISCYRPCKCSQVPLGSLCIEDVVSLHSYSVEIQTLGFLGLQSTVPIKLL